MTEIIDQGVIAAPRKPDADGDGLHMERDDFHVHLCVASAGRPEPEFCMSFAAMVGHFATHHLRGLKTQRLSFNMVSNSIVNEAREELAQIALDRDATHLMFVDDDMVFPANALAILALRQKPIVAANYRLKKKDRHFVSLGLDGINRVTTGLETHGLEEVTFCGFGLCLIDCRILREMEKPWFFMSWHPTEKHYIGEDVMFCVRAREMGFSTYVDHDVSKHVAHIGKYNYRWDSRP